MMEKYKDIKKELLKDKEDKREYDLLEPEFTAIAKMINLKLKGSKI